MRNLILIAIAFVSFTMSAQSISGKAYYESKTTVDMDEFGNAEMTPEIKKMIMDRMKSMLEKTYILTFNGSESIYKEEEKLEAGQGGGMMRMMMGSMTPGAQYKNVETNQILEEREFFGKEFLINDSFENLEWTVAKESKQIGQYLAIKATAVKKVDENDLSMARRRGPRGRGNRGRDRGADREEREEKQEKEEGAATDTKKEEDPNDPMSQIEIPKEVEVTAWFTPQIPVGNGPGEFGGLPGLILEMNMYRTTILCSKIVMNPKDASSIDKPSKGKEVSREEFNKIVKEKTEEMRNNWRGGRGGRGGRN